jgi:putative endonuclease
MKNHVYILESLKTGRFYVGSTRDLEKRLQAHKAGKVSSTKAFLPHKLIYKEEFTTYTETKKRELFIKKRKSRKYIEELVGRSVA